MMKTQTAQPFFFSKYGILILTGLFLGTGYVIWQAWPSLLISSMQWQKDINNQLSELLYDAQADSIAAGLSLAGLSFIYGMLHSLGPGHGKLIVSTYLATHPTKIKLSLTLTVLSALLQAVVAIALVSTLLVIFNSSMREVNSEANRFVTLSFYTVVILGLVIVWRNLRTLWQSFRLNQSLKNAQQPQTPAFVFNTNNITAIKHIPTNTAKPNVILRSAQNTHTLPGDHFHSSDCGCGHQHFADAEVINSASSIKEYLVIILSIGIRPCTGAIMVLLFANMVDMYWLGVVSAFLMAIGTALTTSIIAIMTITGRQLVKRYLNGNKQQIDRDSKDNKNAETSLHLAGTTVQLAGGVALILMGAVLLSSQPVGMSPVF
ncbi:nickel/cobalt transporter [Photobacterium indicum]|uniref:nickel/cobalt transporter n=1 Tax=Photobacterium indicum TaxID=81447 RepID=UPI003D1192F9